MEAKADEHLERASKAHMSDGKVLAQAGDILSRY